MLSKKQTDCSFLLDAPNQTRFALLLYLDLPNVKKVCLFTKKTTQKAETFPYIGRYIGSLSILVPLKIQVYLLKSLLETIGTPSTTIFGIFPLEVRLSTRNDSMAFMQRPLFYYMGVS